MKIKAIVCDIDGTLVPMRQTTSQRTNEIIKKLRQKGILFGVASGRPIEEIKILEKWDFDIDFVIGFNGCQLLDKSNNQLYEYFPMKKEWIKETFEIMKPFNCNPMITYKDYTLYGHYDDKCELSKAFTGKPYVICNDICELYENDNYKIMYRVEPEDMPKIEEHVNAHPSPYFRGFKTTPMTMEFAHIHANKGHAIKEYCKLHNIDIQNVWAFGDATNDNEMLITCGVGVCIANGGEDTKAIADLITDKTCEEDGFADFVEKNIFNRL